MHNLNNTNNTNSGNNVSLNNEQLVRIGINNLDEYSKYKTLRYKLKSLLNSNGVANIIQSKYKRW